MKEAYPTNPEEEIKVSEFVYFSFLRWDGIKWEQIKKAQGRRD